MLDNNRFCFKLIYIILVNEKPYLYLDPLLQKIHREALAGREANRGVSG